MDKMKMQTPDITESNIEKIGQLFPNCLTERIGEDGKVERAIDFDQLRQELSKEIVEGPQERYQFTWPDKKKAIRLANTPSTMTLRPCREESVDFDNTENLYIEGDNLEVLKLLREDYLGKVKMIYIDPPYNTGNDFVYEDDFSQATSDYIGASGQTDASGNRLVQNTESNGRFHTDWLNMIYPRLKVARDLLSEDGVFFISIDDHEQDNLKKVLDQIFGATNFVATINWKRSGGRQDSKYYAMIHEYIHCYARNLTKFKAGEEIKEGDVYPKYDEEKKRFYKTQLLRKWGSNSLRENRPNLYYPIKGPDGSDVYPMIYQSDKQSVSAQKLEIFGCWRWGASTMSSAIAEGRVEFQKNEDGKWIAYEKIFAPLEGEEKTKKYSTWIDDTSNGTDTLKKLFNGKAPFDFSKSPELIERFMRMANVDEEDTILDFFSGSATTAHAVMSINAEDGGNRHFIMVQLPEETSDGSEAHKAGFNNICEIGKERIRRAGKKLVEERSIASSQDGLFAGIEDGTKLDIGFRVLKLDSSNMNDVYYRPEEFSEQLIKEDNVKEDRTAEDLLFQVMLECNLPLSAKIQTEKIAGKDVFTVNNGYLIACFDEDVNEEVIKAVAKRKPYYFVMRDSSLSSDNVADNFEQIFQAYSKDTIRKIL